MCGTHEGRRPIYICLEAFCRFATVAKKKEAIARNFDVRFRTGAGLQTTAHHRERKSAVNFFGKCQVTRIVASCSCSICTLVGDLWVLMVGR